MTTTGLTKTRARAVQLRAVLLATACAVGSPGASADAAAPAAAPRGAPTAQGPLQRLIDEAAPGAILQLEPGTWSGPVVIDKPLTLRGQPPHRQPPHRQAPDRQAPDTQAPDTQAPDTQAPDKQRTTLDGRGRGTTVRIDAPNVTIENLSISHGGRDLDGPDACIYLTPRATDARVRNNTLSNCGFGIWVHQTEDAVLEGNRIHGPKTGHRADRGNGIHLFDAARLIVRDNEISGGRDGIYVSATEDSRIEGNRMSDTRYGIHYMFSYRNVVSRNHAQRNLGGIALMESHGITATHNVSTDNEGHGILFRDAQHCTIRHNRVERNGNGLFFFSSVDNVIEHNVVAHNEVGAKVWAGSNRNQVASNTFLGNRVQIFYVAASDLVWGKERAGNFWSDYLGWDQDADGVGDRPYRVDSFTTRLIHRYPAAALLLRSPALELLTHLEQTVPVLRTPTVIDRRPLSRRPK